MKTIKNLLYGLVATVLAFIMVQGCTKTSDVTALTRIITSKSTLKINEPDSVSVVGVAVTDSVKWSITPAGFNTLSLKSNKGVLSFSKAGTYTISVSVNGGSPITATIVVTTEVYVPTTPPNNTATQVSLANDQIVLHSNYYKNAKGDTTYIYFTAVTTNLYPCGNSTLNYTKSLDASNYFNLSFPYLTQPADANCQKVNTTIATGIIDFKQNSANPYMVPGTYPLIVTVSGTIYSGSIAITNTDITFNWSYTSGVTITPKHFTR